MIASASFDKSVRLWRAHDGAFICTLRGHVQAVYTLAWSADSRLLVSGSKDSTLKGIRSLIYAFKMTILFGFIYSLERQNKKTGTGVAWTCGRSVWSRLGTRWITCCIRWKG